MARAARRAAGQVEVMSNVNAGSCQGALYLILSPLFVKALPARRAAPHSDQSATRRTECFHNAGEASCTTSNKYFPQIIGGRENKIMKMLLGHQLNAE